MGIVYCFFKYVIWNCRTEKARRNRTIQKIEKKGNETGTEIETRTETETEFEREGEQGEERRERIEIETKLPEKMFLQGIRVRHFPNLLTFTLTAILEYL
jgi:hypothetical protein